MVLALAAGVERGSEHPVAVAVVAAARERGLELPAVDEFRSIPGRGAQARIDGIPVWVGRPSSPVDAADAAALLAQWEEHGRTAVVLERDGDAARRDRPRRHDQAGGEGRRRGAAPDGSGRPAADRR